MAKSRLRVEADLAASGIKADIQQMPASTRTAQEAADACGCAVGQIVKSLIFKGEDSADLYLLLVSGANQVNLETVTQLTGETLTRANPKEVRTRTGFAIGGVAPIGHLGQPQTFIDESLLGFQSVWAAAGEPNAVFEISPDELLALTGGQRFRT